MSGKSTHAEMQKTKIMTLCNIFREGDLKTVFHRHGTLVVKKVGTTVLKKASLPTAKERLNRMENLISGQLWEQPRKFKKKIMKGCIACERRKNMPFRRE